MFVLSVLWDESRLTRLWWYLFFYKNTNFQILMVFRSSCASRVNPNNTNCASMVKNRRISKRRFCQQSPAGRNYAWRKFPRMTKMKGAFVCVCLSWRMTGFTAASPIVLLETNGAWEQKQMSDESPLWLIASLSTVYTFHEEGDSGVNIQTKTLWKEQSLGYVWGKGWVVSRFKDQLLVKGGAVYFSLKYSLFCCISIF